MFSLVLQFRFNIKASCFAGYIIQWVLLGLDRPYWGTLGSGVMSIDLIGNIVWHFACSSIIPVTEALNEALDAGVNTGLVFSYNEHKYFLALQYLVVAQKGLSIKTQFFPLILM